MLAKSRRLRRPEEFSAAIKGGVRAGRRTLVVHLGSRPTGHPAVAGFVVSKAVGNSVVRHRVTRQLRHLAAPLLPTLADGTLVVVRALPAAAAASSQTLGADLTSAVSSAQGKLSRTSAHVGRSGEPAGSASERPVGVGR